MPSHVPISVRRSVLSPLDRASRARAVERRLTEAIQLGLFADGEQLPSETVLAAQFGVATVTLRESLSELRRRGLVETRRGRGGGSFVRAPAGDARKRALERLAGYSSDDLRDLADHRAAIAGTAARLAAERASRADLDRLSTLLGAFALATSDLSRRRSDVRLHVELAAIARSRRLTTAEMDIHAEIGALLWLTFSGSDAATARDDHEAIVAAICDHDPDTADGHARAHSHREIDELISIRLQTMRDPSPQGTARDVLDTVGGAVDDVFTAIGSIHALALRTHADKLGVGRALSRDDLRPLRLLLQRQLEEMPEVAGLGMVFAPATLVDEVRWIEWLCATDEGPPEPLVATLDPEAPDFYDYEAAEWYSEPRDRGDRWIAGPFVDHSGTDAHIFTFTRPVIDASGTFLGVAGADLRVAAVEAIAGPALAAASENVILLNPRGRVIAANSAAWLPGTLYATRDADVVTRDPRLPWTAVVPAID